MTVIPAFSGGRLGVSAHALLPAVQTLRIRHSSTSPAEAPAAAEAKPAVAPVVSTIRPQATTMEILREVLQTGREERKKKKAEKEKDAPAKVDAATLKRLLQFAKPEAGTLAAAVATLGVTTAVSLLFPYAIGQILDVSITPDAAFTPSSLSLGLLGLFGAQSAMITLRSALLTISGERMASHIRKDVFKALMSQEVAWFDKQRTGDVINRLSSDTVLIQKALTNNIANGLRSSFMVIGGTAMLVYLSPTLAALSLALIPPVALSGMYYGRYVQGQQKAVQESLGKTAEVAEELVSSIRTVRQFAREADEGHRFAVRVEEAYQAARKIGIVAAYFDGAVHMAANLSLVAVLWYGGNQVLSGAMSAGDLTAFLMYSLYTGFNVSSLSNIYTDLKRAGGAAARIFEITDRAPAMPLSSDAQYWAATDAAVSSPKPLLASSAGTGVGAAGTGAATAVGAHGLVRLPSVRGDLSFEHIDFAYPTRADVPVLRDLQLQLPAGKVLALVGSSGSGKTTVGALLTRLYDPSQGRVLLDGHDIRTLDPQFLRSHIGVVSQEPVLFATSIAANIRYGKPEATDSEVEAAARAAHVHDFVTRLPGGYETLVGERGVQLSGGQKQRVAIARAILKNPPVLLL